MSMEKNLVIVESPAKAKTIAKALGDGYLVTSSFGHIRDLSKKKIGIDYENGFTPDYVIPPDKKDLVKKLTKAAAEASVVWLASDEDREGEAIAGDIVEELKKPENAVGRIIFHEITKQAIDQAIKQPQPLNSSLYDAQKARRVMDRIVGYTMSPLLWKRVKRGLSGGRVQSVAVRLICMRQEEIEKFVSQEYWTIDASLQTPAGDALTARVVEPKEIPDEQSSHRIADQIRGAGRITVDKIKKQVRQKHPQPPFITSTLQQAASSRLRFSAKKTMMIAQQLYEGVSLAGGEVTGLITYMRTDSPVVSGEAIGQARSFIPEAFGKAYLPDKPRQYRAKKSAQQAHEAIRPTDIRHTPEAVKAHLNKEQHALYELIWRRFVSSQMASAVFDQTAVDIRAGEIGLRAAGSIMRFDGFLKVYGNQDEKDTLLPETLVEGDVLTLTDICEKQHFTQPPPRYTEASLIKELEERGIGRPSTYAPIISTIQERGYVKMEQRAFVPTELGRDVNDLLVKHYPNILDIGFTARMEDSLDELEEGKTDYVRTMHTTSGLLEQLATGTTMADAETQVLAYVREWVPEVRKAPLAGNTVGTDRAFLARDMPELESHLHYRIIDVSSIKELSRRWFPRAYFAAPAKTGGHRALGDIRDSITELRYYRQAVFLAQPGLDTPALKTLATQVAAEHDN